MNTVTKEQFFAKINPLNVAGHIQPGPHPYTTVFKLQAGFQQTIGKTVDRYEGGRIVTDYYLAS